MSFINEKTKEVNCKVVYYGSPRCGKSTSLKSICKQVKKASKGELISLNQDDDLLSSSPWYRSKALTLDNSIKPDYCNGVLSVQTSLSPLALLQTLRDIEQKMGRTEKRERWASRVIDLDILFFNDLILKSDELEIPHPEIQNRLFVLKPLCDLSPNTVHPLSGKTCQHLLNDYSAANPHETLICWS